jgi:hypothetical protein
MTQELKSSVGVDWRRLIIIYAVVGVLAVAIWFTGKSLGCNVDRLAWWIVRGILLLVIITVYTAWRAFTRPDFPFSDVRLNPELKDHIAELRPILLELQAKHNTEHPDAASKESAEVNLLKHYEEAVKILERRKAQERPQQQN